MQDDNLNDYDVQDDEELSFDDNELDNIESDDTDLPEESDDNSEDESEEKDEFGALFKKEPKGKPNKLFEQMREKAEEQARKKVEAELLEEKNRIQAMKVAMEQQLSEKRIIDEYLSPKKIYEYADNEGVSEEIAEKMLKYEAQKLIDAEKTKILENFNTLQATKRELQKDKYYSILEKEVDTIMQQYPQADYKAVYYHLKGLKAEELEKQLLSNAEKRTIANLQDKSKRKSIAGSDANVSSVGKLSDFGKRMAIELGADPREVAKHVSKRLKDFKR